MDPISLALLFASGALMGSSYRSYADDQNQSDVVIRPIFAEQPSSYLANELCSRQALLEVGELLDLDLAQYAPQVDSGFFRVVAITQPGAPLKHQVIAILKSTGPSQWTLSEAYREGYRRVSSEASFDRIEEVLEALNEETQSPGELPNVLPDPVMYALPLNQDDSPAEPQRVQTRFSFTAE